MIVGWHEITPTLHCPILVLQYNFARFQPLGITCNVLGVNEYYWDSHQL